MYRPACRINQTGVRSVFSPRAARIKISRSPGSVQCSCSMTTSSAASEDCTENRYREVGHCGEKAEALVEPKAKRANEFKHTLIMVDFVVMKNVMQSQCVFTVSSFLPWSSGLTTVGAPLGGPRSSYGSLDVTGSNFNFPPPYAGHTNDHPSISIYKHIGYYVVYMLYGHTYDN